LASVLGLVGVVVFAPVAVDAAPQAVPASIVSASAGNPAGGTPSGFHAITPFRLVDTRDGTGIPGPLGPGQTATFVLLGQGAIPAAGVVAVVVNVTLVMPTETTHLTVWPDGQALPATSSVNATAAAVAANLQFLAPGPGGGAQVRNNSGTAHVLVDVTGWLGADGFGRFHPTYATQDPYDVMGSTNIAVGAGDAGATDVRVDETSRLPLDRVSALVVDVGFQTGSPTHLTVWTPGAPLPPVSSLNATPTGSPAVDIERNLVVVVPDAQGRVRLRNNEGVVQVGMTVVGWFDDHGSSGGELVAIPPVRVADARTGDGLPTSGLKADVAVLGRGGIPATGVAALVVTLTVVGGPGNAGVSAGTGGAGMTAVSGAPQEVFVGPGEAKARLVVVAPGIGGTLRAGSTYGGDLCCGQSHPLVVLDVVGYFTAAASAPDEVKRRFGPNGWFGTGGCDPIAEVGSPCLAPWPNDLHARPSSGSPTGHVVDVRGLVPSNKDGVALELPDLMGLGSHDPTNRTGDVDGFSPGSKAIAYVPGVDLAASGAPPATNPQASLAADSPVLLLDVTEGVRVPVWVDYDARASADADRVLVITPARVLREGHRHVVVLRALVAVGGGPVAPSEMFRALRDDLVTDLPALEDRRAAYDRIFGEVASAGIDRGSLVSAWAFTVRSPLDAARRMLSIRDRSFAAVGDHAPPFAVTAVEENPSPNVARRVHGQFVVPNFLVDGGGPGTAFDVSHEVEKFPGAVPAVQGFRLAFFQCNVPYSALGPGGGASPGPVAPSRISLYGHGLLGSRTEVNAGNVGDMGQAHNITFCATDLIGLAEEDILAAAVVLTDLSKFATIPDRLQQGMLNTLFLGRLVRDDEGLVTHPAFRVAGQPVIDTSELFYDGNSQGGIMGAATTAVSQEWTRAVLGVTGMNYSMLLPRSVDFEPFLPIFEAAYPNEREQLLLLEVIQLLWDRADPVGYVQHLTSDPYPGTPPHKVLLHVAFGDHQVAQVSAEILARAIGARVHQPALAPGRHTDLTPYWGIDPIGVSPFDGSALVIWDSGTPAPPLGNTPPKDGSDPHEFPRRQLAARLQKSEFLKPGGAVVDVCAGAPCLAPP